MNKRFSTLLAAALVAGGLSANAQTTQYGVSLVSDQIYTGTPVRNYVLTTSGTRSSVISVDGDVAKTQAASLTSVDSQLWTIAVTTVSGSNRFVLTNKATGLTLSFDPKSAVAADATGNVAVPTNGMSLESVSTDTEWTWYSAPNATSELQGTKEFTCAFTADSTMALAVNNSNEIFAYKYANNNVPTAVTALKLQVLIPQTQVMTAADLNVLGTGANTYFTLSTSKTGLEGASALINKKFHAEDNTANPGYVWLKNIESGAAVSKYAYVDTAFHVGTGTNANMWYKFANTQTASDYSKLANPEAFDFQIVRDLFKDSVMVSVNKEGLKEKSATAAANGSYWQNTQTGVQYTTPYNVVSAIQLTADTEVLTLYAANKDENLLFALSSPAADNTLTSVADGVYFITDEDGKYYAVPVHGAQNATTATASWVTVNDKEQNPAHMPAYQWVVLKDKTSDKVSATSPVTLVNREFPSVTITSAQLKKDANATYYYGIAGADSTALNAVPAEVLSDSLLGYKYFEKNDLLVNRYTFNYLHAYAQDKYIAKSATDSLATVLNGKGIFTIKAADALTQYGYIVNSAVAARIPGLKTLYRQSYTVEVPGTPSNSVLGVSAESKYAISSYVSAASFWFKENNSIEDVCYHAMIEHVTDYSKAGVTDDDMSATLKNQVWSETRTSAFLIAPYDAPLYRRFNSALLEGNEGDASDTLRFVEKYRGEYLQVEQNENFKVKGIDFLGIYTKNYTDEGKSFIVDTAWTGCGLKPQYLISIDREDQAFAEGEMCPVCQEIVANGGTRPANCPHDAAGKVAFHFGQYLVNFADSVANAENKADYAWKGYTRAGFVKAAHQGDSLYILVGPFADVTLSTFDAAAINAAITADASLAQYRINLRSEGHKNVTWSMRYVNPEAAANEVEEDRAFLIESDGDQDIAPVNGSWLKMQNGCLVISGSDGSASTFTQFTNDDDALIFNVEKGNAEDIATENEVIVAEGITVVAGNGNVTIAGAAGKKVVIANILGQTVANTVLTSDNATIAVPAGIVVVAVEGEDAVKTIVK